MRKVLLIGQAPSKTAGKNRAFEGRSGERLAGLLGMNMDEFFQIFETVNLLKRWPGKHGGKYAYREKGDRFPIGYARKAAKRIAGRFGRFPVVIFAGRRVAKVFGHDLEHFRMTLSCGNCPEDFLTLLFSIPHPSPVNQFWNDPTNRETAKAALHRALRWL